MGGKSHAGSVSTSRKVAVFFALVLTCGILRAVPQATALAECTIVGTDGADILVGTDGDDVICGGAGDDVLIGGFGSDTIYGGDGNDRLSGGIGNDLLFGEAGNDQLTSGGGNDQLDGGAGDDELVGGFTNDNMIGGAGSDICDDDGSDQRSECEAAYGSAPLRIMTLGDSITEGGYPSGKYRTSLAEHLDDQGCRYDYVGSVVDEQLRWGDSYDPDHEGHGGWTADDLLAEAPAWLATASPDVVILHAGTNDLYRSHTIASTVADIEALIAAARTANAAVSIVVARIIPGDFIEAGVLELNTALDAAIPSLDQPDSRVVLVDQHTGFDLDLHTHDRIHPNDTGARVMGDRFWEAVKPLAADRCFAAAPAGGPSTSTTAPAPPPATTSPTTTAPPTTTTSPATTTTTTPEPTPESNLMENSSMETTMDSWAPQKSGNLSAIYIWNPEGADGAKSLRVYVRRHQSGDASWAPDPAETTPETEYLYTGSYKATTDTNLVAHHTMADGTSVYTQLGALPPADTWIAHTALITTPAASTHTRVLHTIGEVGTLDIDNITLRAADIPQPPTTSPTTTTALPTTTTSAPATTTTTAPPATTTTTVQSTTTTAPSPPTTVAPPQTGARDALQQPFTSDSIWNMPIGSDAIYVPANIATATGAGMTIDQDILILDPDAPKTPVYENFVGWSDRTAGARCTIQGGLIGEWPIPADYVIPHPQGTTPNNAAAILLADRRSVVQTQPLTRCEAGGHATSWAMYPTVDLYDDGIEGAHGGSGLSTIGGTIRLGELIPGGTLRHALKLNIHAEPNLYYKQRESDSRSGYRWPATKADNYAKGVYGGNNPSLQMGSLLALEPSIDLDANALGLETEPARILATAMQDYGAYLVDDTAWSAHAIAAEAGPAGNVVDEFESVWGFAMEQPSTTATPWARDMARLFEALSVVDNNSPSSIGGGGTPRVLMAAPLTPPTE